MPSHRSWSEYFSRNDQHVWLSSVSQIHHLPMNQSSFIHTSWSFVNIWLCTWIPAIGTVLQLLCFGTSWQRWEVATSVQKSPETWVNLSHQLRFIDISRDASLTITYHHVWTDLDLSPAPGQFVVSEPLLLQKWPPFWAVTTIGQAFQQSTTAKPLNCQPSGIIKPQQPSGIIPRDHSTDPLNSPGGKLELQKEWDDHRSGPSSEMTPLHWSTAVGWLRWRSAVVHRIPIYFCVHLCIYSSNYSLLLYPYLATILLILSIHLSLYLSLSSSVDLRLSLLGQQKQPILDAFHLQKCFPPQRRAVFGPGRAFAKDLHTRRFGEPAVRPCQNRKNN